MHFVGLVNVADLKPGGMGNLGAEQLAWLKRDLAGHTASTPIVVFAHIPLWTVYAQWGWGTGDAQAALALLRRFGSVTILNGHIHQIAQKVEGTDDLSHRAVDRLSPARARERPLSRPAARPAGPAARGAGDHRRRLRARRASDRADQFHPRLKVCHDKSYRPLLSASTALALPAAIASCPRRVAGTGESRISPTSPSAPRSLTVKVGQTVTWTNDDDIPHTVVATDKSFRSKVLDTGQSFSFTFTKAGEFAYFCSLHPMMTGKIVVTAR